MRCFSIFILFSGIILSGNVWYVDTTGVEGDSLQAAIDAAAACPGFDTVIVADGHYYLTSHLNMVDSVILMSENGFEACTLDAEKNDRVIVNTGAIDCEVKGFTIMNGQDVDSSPGGGLYNTGNIIVDSCFFTKNVSTYGGAIAVMSGGRLSITNSIFQIDSAITVSGNEGKGGAIYAESTSVLEMFNLECRNCYSSNDGAALYIYHQDTSTYLSIRKCGFYDNFTDGDGTVFLIGLNGDSVVLESTYFYRNTTEQGGGLVLCYLNSPVKIKNCEFINNTGTFYGGGINIVEVSDTVLISETVIESCSVSTASGIFGKGGGIYWESGSGGMLIISGGRINNNTAYMGGGGYFAYPDTVKFQDVEITHNNSVSEGGGIYGISSAKLYLTDCVISSNYADSGGGFCFEGTQLSLTDCDIVKNRAGEKGGGIVSNNNGNVYITGSKILENQSDGYGGAIEVGFQAVARVYNSFLAENASLDSVNSGLAYAEPTGECRIYNSNVYYNTYQPDTEYNSKYIGTQYLYNDYWFYTDSSTIAGLFSGDVDFTPYETTTVLDAPGEPLSIDSVRVFTDPGFSSPPVIPVVPCTLYVKLYGEDREPDKREAAFVIAKSDIVPDGIAVLLWETGPGTGIYTGSFSVFDTTGGYDLRTDDINNVLRCRGSYIKVVANVDTTKYYLINDRNLWYVDTTGVEGDSLNNVISLAGSSIGIDTILLDNGTYHLSQFTEGLNLVDSIVLMSINGMEACTLTAVSETYLDTAERVLYGYNLQHVQIKGITIIGGEIKDMPGEPGGGSICFQQVDGVIIDSCRISSGSAQERGGGVYIYRGPRVRIRNSIIEDNRCFNGLYPTGGGLYVEDVDTLMIENCVVRNNLSSFGGGMYLGTIDSLYLSSSLIENNKSLKTGGGIQLDDVTGSINGCYIIGDSADLGGGLFLGHSISGRIKTSRIENCFASDSGGGIYCEMLGDFQISGCLITRNRAGVSGGGMFLLTGNINIDYSNFTENIAEEGGAFEGVDGGGKIHINNSMFVDNGSLDTTETYQSGFGLTTMSDVRMHSSNVYYNTFQDDYEYANLSGSFVDFTNNYWRFTDADSIRRLFYGNVYFEPYSTSMNFEIPSEPDPTLIGQGIFVYRDSNYTIPATLLRKDRTIYVKMLWDYNDPLIWHTAVLRVTSAKNPEGIVIALTQDSIDTENRYAFYGKLTVKSNPEGDERYQDIKNIIGVNTVDTIRIWWPLNPRAHAEVPFDGSYWYVDTTGIERDSIQNTIDSAFACPGMDTILFADGYYDISSGELNIKDSLILISEHGWDACTLDMRGAGRMFHMDSTNYVVMKGFTIMGGYNQTEDSLGGAGYLYKCGYTKFDSCRFINNRVTGSGGALALYQCDDVHIENCVFIGDSAFLTGTYFVGSGGGIYDYYSAVSISNTIFEDCYADNYGGCLFTIGWSSENLNNVRFTVNTGKYGGGVAFGSRDINVTNCRFEGCSGFYGGAIYAISPGGNHYITIDSCSFINNHADSIGGAIYAKDRYYIEMRNAEVIGNSSTLGGGIAVLNTDGARVKLKNSLFSLNISDSTGGAFFSDGGLILVDSCSICENGALNSTGAGLGYVTGDDTLFINWSNVYFNTYQNDVDYKNDGTILEDLTNNYWAETDSVEIAGMIEGPATFYPFETGYLDYAPGEPLYVDSIKILLDTIPVDTLWNEDTLKVIVYGIDRTPSMIEVCCVVVRSSVYPDGIALGLVETDRNTGIYEGLLSIEHREDMSGIRIDDINQTIGVDSLGDIITVVTFAGDLVDTVYYREGATGIRGIPDIFALTVPGIGKGDLGFQIPERSRVRIEVFDAIGRLVKIPVDRYLNPGYYRIHLELPTGLYFVRMKAGGFKDKQRMILLK